MDQNLLKYYSLLFKLSDSFKPCKVGLVIFKITVTIVNVNIDENKKKVENGDYTSFCFKHKMPTHLTELNLDSHYFSS